MRSRSLVGQAINGWRSSSRDQRRSRCLPHQTAKKAVLRHGGRQSWSASGAPPLTASGACFRSTAAATLSLSCWISPSTSTSASSRRRWRCSYANLTSVASSLTLCDECSSFASRRWCGCMGPSRSCCASSHSSRRAVSSTTTSSTGPRRCSASSSPTAQRRWTTPPRTNAPSTLALAGRAPGAPRARASDAPQTPAPRAPPRITPRASTSYWSARLVARSAHRRSH
mmetsp:Transcript_40958/g.135686  ORF Transcript_40958/g.135686 Transcript_40958/m.135686 type:complete len:227 (-) Transcript_40958:3978-4658(-)